jgi:hypothetical protein
VIANGKIWFQLWQVQGLCWILPLILALMPLTTNIYSSGDPDLQWCLIAPRNNTPPAMTLFWAYASFFFWLLVCILLMVYWGLMIQWRYWGSIASPIVRRTYEKVWLYPVALSLCWLLNMVCVSVPSISESPLFVGLSMVFGVSNGILNTVIFMRNNGEILQRWVHLLQGKKEPSDTPSSVSQPSDRSSSVSMQSAEQREFRSTAIWYGGSSVFGDSEIVEEDFFATNRSTTEASNAGDVCGAVAAEIELERGSAGSHVSVTIGSSRIRHGDFEVFRSPLMEEPCFK